jgi:FkbM family methyltransferase
MSTPVPLLFPPRIPVGAPLVSPLQVQVEIDPSRPPLRFELEGEDGIQRVLYRLLQQGRPWEEDLTTLLLSLLRPGDWMVDAGGHVGYATLLAAVVVGDRGRVTTFEALPANASRIARHLDLNAFQHVELWNVAVGAAPGVLPFYADANNSGAHALWGAENQVATCTVPVCRMEEVFASIVTRHGESPVRFLKMDIEGSELAALAGLGAWLSPDRVEYIFAEVHARALTAMGASPAALFEVLERAGYAACVWDRQQQRLRRLDGPIDVPEYNALWMATATASRYGS